MVEDVGSVDTQLQRLGLGDSDRFAGRCIEVPGSRQHHGVLTEIAPCPRKRVLEHDRPCRAVRVSHGERVDRAAAVANQVESHLVGNVRTLTLRIRYGHELAGVVEERSSMGVPGGVVGPIPSNRSVG